MLLTAAVFIAGPAMTSYVPRCLAGLIMMDLSVHLMMEALVTPYNEFDRFEYGTVVAITVVIAVGGFMNGIAFGLIAVCATFILQSSKQVSVRGTLAGAAVRSNAFRNAQQRNQMHTMYAAQRICVVQLQGNLFFANVQQVTSRVERAVKQMQNGVRRRKRAVTARATAAAAYAAATNADRSDLSSNGWREAEGVAKQGVVKRTAGSVGFKAGSMPLSPRVPAHMMGGMQPMSPRGCSPREEEHASMVGDTCYCIIDLSFVTHVDCTASLRLIKTCMSMYEQQQTLHQQAMRAQQQAAQAEKQQAAQAHQNLAQQQQQYNHTTVSGASGAQLAKELFQYRTAEGGRQGEAASLKRTGSIDHLHMQSGRRSAPAGGESLRSIFQDSENGYIPHAGSPSPVGGADCTGANMMDCTGTDYTDVDNGPMDNDRPVLILADLAHDTGKTHATTPSYGATEGGASPLLNAAEIELETFTGRQNPTADSSLSQNSLHGSLRRRQNSTASSVGSAATDEEGGKGKGKWSMQKVRTKLWNNLTSNKKEAHVTSEERNEDAVSAAVEEFRVKVQEAADEMVRVKFYFAGATTAVRSQLEVVATSMKVSWLHRHMHRDVNDALRYAEDQIIYEAVNKNGASSPKTPKTRSFRDGAGAGSSSPPPLLLEPDSPLSSMGFELSGPKFDQRVESILDENSVEGHSLRGLLPHMRPVLLQAGR
jgi:hypothetical protein